MSTEIFLLASLSFVLHNIFYDSLGIIFCDMLTTHTYCVFMQGKATAITSGEWEVIDILKVTTDSV